MSARNRIIVIAASLLLLVAYWAPLWSITLKAPQYPEGLGIYIWVNNITGHSAHDLSNINNLNHYIGMKAIVPDSIPELKYMPFMLAGLIALGLLGGILGSRNMMRVWLVLFVALTLAGLTDFYLWGYDYGHNLNPEAAIKIPNMTYQPPLIGWKQLLNFRAISLPAAGSYVMGLSFVAVLFAVSKRERKRVRQTLELIREKVVG